MIHCPKYSVGSKVELESGESGEIVSIEATLKVGESNKYSYKIVYLVDLGNATRKTIERHIKDVKDISPKIVDDMDKFIADMLLLSRPLDPDRIDTSIKNLLKTSGGE